MAASATLINGAARYSDPSLINLSVASARARYAGAFNISTTARAMVNGRETTGDTVLKAGDVLTFDEPTGAKG